MRVKSTDEEYKAQLSELYGRLTALTDVAGEFELEDCFINWRRGDDVCVQIELDIVSWEKAKVDFWSKNTPSITHGHPDGDLRKIISFVKEYGKRGEIVVLRNHFPYIIFRGPAEGYRTKLRRFLPGRKYIFGEK